MKRFFAFPAAVALALAGCEGTPVEPAAADIEPVFLASQLASAGAKTVSSARGSGHLTRDDENRTFAFTVGKSSDGSTKGMFQIKARDRDPDITVHADIQCVSFDGNTAWFSGPITGSNSASFPEGRVLGIVVVDNGEGANAIPDQVSLATPFTPADPQVWCDLSLTTLQSIITTFDVENGNVQVNP